MKICGFYGPGPRRVATHAQLCNWVASDNISPKLVIFQALKGLNKSLKKLMLLMLIQDIPQRKKIPIPVLSNDNLLLL